MISRTALISILILINVTSWGQGIDSAAVDLKQLKDLGFFKKFTRQVRDTDKDLRQKGVPTVTMIVERPTKDNKFYVIGHYQLPTKDHMTRMSFYRVDTLQNKIDYQNMDDFIHGKWKKLLIRFA